MSASLRLIGRRCENGEPMRVSVRGVVIDAYLDPRWPHANPVPE